jgi:phage recombination protein Bet
VQEKEPPYLVTVIELPPELVDIGRARNRRALERFRDCTESDLWPGYVPDDTFANPPRPAGRSTRGARRMTEIAVPQHGSTLTLTTDQEFWTEKQIAGLRQLGVDRASNGDLAVFMHVAQRTGLDPFARQIYMIERQGKQTIQTGIDGFRLVARRAVDRAGESLAIGGGEWCGPTGPWRDVWLEETPPAAARVVVKRGGHEFVGVALFREYAQTKRDGALMAQWASRPAGMLAKCAEALALRKAFPLDLAGVYTDDEMSRAEQRPERRSALGDALASAPLNDLPSSPTPPPASRRSPHTTSPTSPRSSATPAAAKQTPPTQPQPSRPRSTAWSTPASGPTTTRSTSSAPPSSATRQPASLASTPSDSSSPPKRSPGRSHDHRDEALPLVRHGDLQPQPGLPRLPRHRQAPQRHASRRPRAHGWPLGARPEPHPGLAARLCSHRQYAARNVQPEPDRLPLWGDCDRDVPHEDRPPPGQPQRPEAAPELPVRRPRRVQAPTVQGLPARRGHRVEARLPGEEDSRMSAANPARRDPPEGAAVKAEDPSRPSTCPICGLMADNAITVRSELTASATYCDTAGHLWSVTWLEVA